MGLGDLFRRMVGSSPGTAGAEDQAIEQEEYGAEPSAQEPASDFIAGGPMGQGFQGLESAEAADAAIHATDPPEDPAR